MPWVAICERLRTGMGRNQDKTYINVLTSTRQISDDAATWAGANPTHPWTNPLFNEFIVDLTDQEAADINNGVNPLTWGAQNNPRWQQQNEGSGATPAFGSWVDPEDSATAWTLGTPIPDDRWIVRVYTDAAATNHVASEEFDEGVTGATVERFIKLFNFDDTPAGTNAGNQRTEIGGKLVDFDFGSSDGLDPGVARIKFGIDVAGRGEWFSNHRYRVIGPAGEASYIWQVFGKTLRIAAE